MHPDWEDISAEANTESAWRHIESENRLAVNKFDDGTWDAKLNERLVANHDSRKEALEKVEKLMQNSCDRFDHLWE